ncbi:MAG: CPBP family intramembrane metalloprotease [Clostridia bacterium]|nr:CPBP family intramembrane metalloprotease [Clostridia bacterium]
MSKTGKTILRFFAVTAAFILFRELVDRLGWKLALALDNGVLDPDGVFLAVSIHHVVYVLCTLPVCFALHKAAGLEFPLKPRRDDRSARFVARLCLVFLVYNLGWYLIVGVLERAIVPVDYALTAVNVAGTLGFQLFLSGTGEELLCRALPITCLRAACGEQRKSTDSVILLITALLFAAGHIRVSAPLSTQWYNLLYVFVHGMIYGMVYLRAKSVIYPMILHGVSNVLSVGGCYLYMLLCNP